MAEEEAKEPLLNNEESSEKSEEMTQECRLFKDVNVGLLPPKLFYFFFFAANGTLVPYLILFFKQIGLSPSQVGIVIGFKPFISFICSPIWGYIADKTKKTKLIFIISLIAYVSGYFSYSFAPTKQICTMKSNSTKHDDSPLMHTHVHTRRSYRLKDIDHSKYGHVEKSRRNILLNLDSLYRRKDPLSKDINHRKIEKVKKSHIPSRHRISYDAFYPADLSSSIFQMPVSAIDFISLNPRKKSKVSPSTTIKPIINTMIRMTTSKALPPVNLTKFENSLEKKISTYNLAVPLSIEKSWSKAVNRQNGPWTVCAAAKANTIDDIFFSQSIDGQVNLKAIFSYLLTVTVIATLFSCPLITIVDTATIRKLKETGETHKYGKQRMWGSLGWGISSFGVGAIISAIPLCPGINNEVNYYPSFYIFAVLLLIALIIGLKLQFNDKETDTVECETVIHRAMKIRNGLRLLTQPLFFSFMFTSFYIGITMSIIKTFLFWHLKDIGGTQMLFSVISAINCVAEVFVYFFSSTFIQRVGHIKVLYSALVCYSLRLFYYGLLTNPWYVLAAEPLSGITTAAAWAAMTSFVGLNANSESVTTLQGILHGVHWGLGHGCGELLGGFMVSWIGAASTFNVFGFVTIIELVMFLFINKIAMKSEVDKGSGNENDIGEEIGNEDEFINKKDEMNMKNPSCH